MAGEVQHEVEYLVVEVCREHYSRAHNLFGELGLYRGQPAILKALWKQDGLTHSELAGLMRVQPATVTKMAQRLEQAGFVTRRPDPDDQRVSRVYLTEAARAVEADVKQVSSTLAEELLHGFTPEEVLLLRRFLIQMRDNLMAANDS